MAESSGPFTCNPVVRRAGIVFTVARCEAHPHNPQTSSAKAYSVTNRNFVLNDKADSGRNVCNSGDLSTTCNTNGGLDVAERHKDAQNQGPVRDLERSLSFLQRFMGA